MILDTMKNLSFDLVHKSADEFVGACPWCGGDDRFHVWESTGGYWCRQCKRQGDEIQLIRDYKKMTYPEACEYLGIEPKAKAATGHHSAPVRHTWQPKAKKPVNEMWSQKTGGLLAQFVSQLWQNKSVLQWLHNDRGLSDETIKTARLGWCSQDFFFDLQSFGLAPEINPKTGKQKSVWIPSGLIIPNIIDAQVVRLRIRRENPKENQDRYIVVKGGSMRPMVLSGRSKSFVVVESELDALLINQVTGDIINVIAMGSAQIRPDEQTHEILKHSDIILNCLDSDEAGAKESWTFWNKHFHQIKRWPCVRGKDPGEMLKAGVNLRKWILAGLPVAGPVRPVDDPMPKKETVIDFNKVGRQLPDREDKLKSRLSELIIMAENSRGMTPDQVRAISDEGDKIIEQLPPEAAARIFNEMGN